MSTRISRRRAIGAAAGAAPVAITFRARAERAHGTPAPSGPAPGTPAGAPRLAPTRDGDLFTISLAQWSLHRTLRSGELAHTDFPRSARDDFGIDAVEYVNTFFEQKASDEYNRALRRRCDDLGVTSVLIMCDGEGRLGDPDAAARRAAVDNHRKWLDAAAALGCRCIRVNAQSAGDAGEQERLAADGLRALCERSDPMGLGVIVENHGGLSSNGAWLARVIRRVDHPRAGTLPDFGNFTIGDGVVYERYRGVREMMPFAQGVSAKSHDFDETGDEIHTDYRVMLRVVLAAGYRGRIGVEYEGDRLPEAEGVRATKRLLETVRAELAAEYAAAPRRAS